MDIKTQINQAAMGCFAEVMKLSRPDQGKDTIERFKLLTTITVNDEPKLLLLFGKAHPYFGDGQAYAVLNPSTKVLDCVDPLYSYEISAFAGECDLMTQQWINTNGETPRAAGGYSYTARKWQPARTALTT
jgi:hypothetical protein